MHAEAYEREDVNRYGDPWDLAALLRHVGTEQCAIPLLEEGEQGRMISPGLPNVPACAQEKSITR